jgi:hypothetical protein
MDWKLLDPNDPLYDPNEPKWAAYAYGRAARADEMPTTAPDGTSVGNGHWSIVHIPPENVLGGRFIATRREPTKR